MSDRPADAAAPTAAAPELDAATIMRNAYASLPSQQGNQPEPEREAAPEQPSQEPQPQAEPEQPQSSNEELQRLQKEYEALQTTEQQQREFIEQLQQIANQQAQEARTRQQREQEEQRLQAIADTYEQMPDSAAAKQWLSQQLLGVINERDQQWTTRLQQLENEARTAIQHITVPQWAQEYAKEEGLADDFAKAFGKMNDPQLVTNLLPVFKELSNKYTDLEKKAGQIAAEQRAQEMQASGAHHVGGTGTAPTSGDDFYSKPHSKSEMISRLGQILAQPGAIRRE
jgi:flagellar motility protein MotE (MotC chaperone)